MVYDLAHTGNAFTNKDSIPYVRMSIHVGNQVMEFSNITSVEHNT